MKGQEKQQGGGFADRMGIIDCSPTRAKAVVKLCMLCGHVAAIAGEAGIGKTQLTKQICEETGYRPWFIFLAHKQPEDIQGIPFPNKDGLSYKFLCEETILQIVQDDKPALIILDEWNRGERQVMNAAFTLMEDRRYGNIVLPDNTRIVAAMNPSEQSYLVNEAEKDPAFRRRLCFIGMTTSNTAWLEHATTKGDYHNAVINYIKTKPDALMDISAREAGKVYANPAAWEKVSDTLKLLDSTAIEEALKEKSTLSASDKKRIKREYTNQMLPVLRVKLAGHINVGAAELFCNWLQDNNIMLSPHDILYSYPKVRERVQQLVDAGRHEILTQASEAVAQLLITERPKAESVAEAYGMFLDDIPAEVGKVLTKLIGDAMSSDTVVQNWHHTFTREISALNAASSDAFYNAQNTMLDSDKRIIKEATSE